MRSVIRYEPLSPFTLRDTFNQVFNGFPRLSGSAGWNGAEARTYTPPANLYETEGAFNVVVSLPGVDPNEVEVSIKQQTLTVSGSRRLPMPEAANPLWRGIAEGAFTYAFNLPAQIQPEAIEARYEHGLLLLNLPKADVARAHRIPVQAGPRPTPAQPEPTAE